jgi:hypothetical protein
MKKFQIKKDNQIFSRFEIKYVLKKEKSSIIQNEIKNFMISDKYLKEDYTKRYYVRSLYFDNDCFSHFNEKADGIKNRHKFRIRTYSDQFNKDSIFYLEQKGRDNERTYKVRTKINKDDLDLFFDKKELFKLKKRYPENYLIEKFIFDMYRKKLSPKVLVDYFRRPLVNKSGLYFRITFDSILRASASDTLFNPKNSWKNCIKGYETLEVKFDQTIPPWFQKIIQNFELRRVSISKFLLGTETTGLAEDFDSK